jgi:thioredoxin reductase
MRLLHRALLAAAACAAAAAAARLHDDRSTCIVGAGPGGLQLAYFLQRAGRDYIILERNASAGAFFARYPRHRTLISVNKRHTGHALDEPRRTADFNLRHDWNSLVHDEQLPRFTNYSRVLYPPADTMVRYLNDFAEVYALNVAYSVEVTSIARAGEGGFRVGTATAATYGCQRVVLATGIHTPNIPKIGGVEHLDRYDDMSVNPDDFEGKSIMIVGNGNSGFETASNLIASANYIHMVSRSAVRLTIATHYVGDVRLTAEVGAVVEGYQLKSLVGFAEKNFSDLASQAYFDKDPTDNRITLKMLDGSTRFTEAYDASIYPLDRRYDHVFLCTGFKFDSTPFDSTAMPEMMIVRKKVAGHTRSGNGTCDSKRGGASNKRRRRLREGDYISPKYPSMGGGYESTNVKNLYFAGTLSHALGKSRCPRAAGAIARGRGWGRGLEGSCWMG